MDAAGVSAGLVRVVDVIAEGDADAACLLARVVEEARRLVDAEHAGSGEPSVADAVCVPAGSVQLWFARRDGLDEHARAFVTAVAKLAALAIERARSLQRTQLVDAVTDEGIWYWDVVANTIEWNDRLLAIHGFDRDGWSGRYEDWFERLHPDDQPRLAGALRAHLETRTPYRIERFRLRHASGAYRWYTAAGQAAWDEAGAPIYMAGTVRDITAEVVAIDELHASEHRYQQILDSVQDMVFCKNERLVVTYANAATCRYYGLTQDQLRGLTDVPYNEIDFTQQYIRDDRDVFERGVVIERDNEPNRAPDGKLQFFDTVKAPVRDETGAVVELVGVSRNVTRRKREIEDQQRLHAASEMLARSIDFEATLANVARAVVPEVADWCAIDLVDDGGAIRRVAIEHAEPEMIALAVEFHRRYGPPPDATYDVPGVIRTGKAEMMTGLTEEMFAATARDAEHLSMLRALRIHSYIIVPMTVRDRRLGAITLVTQDTRPFDAHDLAFAEELGLRAAIALENAMLYREVRELNTGLEQRVTERTAELTEANEELEAFSYTVSHDLRAPVRHIGSFADLLAAHPGATLDETARSFVERIKGAATHMGMLVDGLLAFSRLGRAELYKRSVSLGDLVAQVRAGMEADLQGRQVEWRIGALPVVHGDATMLRVVLMNLLGNAVKYTRLRALATIEIGSDQRDREHVVWVRDNGAGFQMEYAHKLFGMFQRLHSDADFEGTGIGLASARRAIHRHGGRMWAEGAPDAGATFYFTLPREARR